MQDPGPKAGGPAPVVLIAAVVSGQRWQRV